MSEALIPWPGMRLILPDFLPLFYLFILLFILYSFMYFFILCSFIYLFLIHY